MDEHAELKGLIEAYLAGDLSTDEETKLLAHVEECSSCHESLTNAKKLEDLLVRSFSAVAVPFTRAKPLVLNGVDPSALAEPAFYCNRQHRGMRFRNIAFGVTVAAVLMLAFGIVIYVKFMARSGNHPEIAIKLAKGEATLLFEAIEKYQRHSGQAPGSNPEMVKQLSALGSGGSPFYMFKKQDLTSGEYRDPWKNPYKLVLRDNRVVGIYSFGLNGKDEQGRGDDIVVGSIK